MSSSEEEKKNIESTRKKEHKYILRDEDIEDCDLQHLKTLLKDKGYTDIYENANGCATKHNKRSKQTHLLEF